MYWVAFGRWRSAAGSHFIRHRVYLRGRWTPFVRMRIRYTSESVLRMRAEQVEELQRARAEAIGWTWAEACTQLDRGMDPRKFPVPNLLAKAGLEL
jgi:hypothetical protein